jgi:hypothetical protein
MATEMRALLMMCVILTLSWGVHTQNADDNKSPATPDDDYDALANDPALLNHFNCEFYSLCSTQIVCSAKKLL